jgi:hypothetical protein
MRIMALAFAVVLLSASAADAGKYRYSHRVVVTGRLVDHWTIDDPEDCGPVGDGTVTADFRSAKPSRAHPRIDPSHSGAGGGLGSWALLAPVDAFGHIGSLPPKRAVGTIDLVDNTVPRPSYDGSDCGAEIEKAGCGSHPLHSDARVVVAGYNRRFIYVDLYELFTHFGPCHMGLVESFSQPPRSAGDLLRIRMPTPSKLRTQKVVTVTGSSHKRSSHASRTSDVTRTATVTFTRLR